MRALLVVMAVWAVGCARDGQSSSTFDGMPVLDFSTGAAVDGNGVDGLVIGDCSDQAKLVYLVDKNNDFLSFKPDTATFTKIGTLACPASGATPFSMGVDRSGTAWVLYNSGALFKVSTTDASCAATSYVPDQQGLNVFGMGFSSNSAGSSDETLYIAGSGTMTLTSHWPSLGTLSFPSLTVSITWPISGKPELTGTGAGELWGFFPSATQTPRVAKIDKSTGADGTVYPLASLLGTPRAWAFAFWGGDFWVFLKRDTDVSTSVYRVDGTTGALSTAVPNTGRTIVGAGVSTCAPLTVL